MDKQLRSYVDALFENAPPTMKTVEIKEEILQNTLDRYRDLLAEGKSEQAAFNIAIAGIGDVEELLQSLQEEQDLYGAGTGAREGERRNLAILQAVAIMLYILCILPVLLLGDVWGVSLMFVMIALATGILVYHGKMGKPYRKTDDTMVENFKEWNAEREDRKTLRRSILAAISSITLVIYFVISFATHAWHITWLIFLISAAVRNVVKACFELRKGEDR